MAAGRPSRVRSAAPRLAGLDGRLWPTLWVVVEIDQHVVGDVAPAHGGARERRREEGSRGGRQPPVQLYATAKRSRSS